MLTSSDAEEEIEDSQEQREPEPDGGWANRRYEWLFERSKIVRSSESQKIDGWMGQQKEGVGS